MRISLWLVAGTAAACAAVLSAAGQPDPFVFFEPTVKVTAADRAHLDRGDVIARALPSDKGQIAVFAATRLNAAPGALVEWTRAIEDLKQSPLVLSVRRFSEPPHESDLDGLSLEDGELDELRRCRTGSCNVKLAADEIAYVRQAIRAAGDNWREAAQLAFRRILVERVRLHRSRGLLALPSYADRGHPMSVGEAFSAIAARSPYLTRAFPDVVNSLLAPSPEPTGHESFYYWSRERYGAGRTVVTITCVRLLQPGGDARPQALSISTQLYASHYIEGALGVTAVVCDDAREACYLAYLNRTQIDLLGGFFGAFKRAAIEGRIESDTPNLLRGVRQRLESGAPGAKGGHS